MTDPNAEALEASSGMVITIAIYNSSSADLGIQAAALTGGNWQGPTPEPGTVLATGTTNYVNVSASIFAGCGGFITLVPASGGSINMSWSWTPQSSVIAYGVASGTSTILMSYSVANASTYSPTVTYAISDAGVGEQPEKWHADRPV